MPRYRYRAFTPEGKVIEESKEVPSEEVLLKELASLGYTVIDLRPEGGKVKEEKEEKKEGGGFKIPFFGGGVSDKDLALLCKQLSSLLGAGVGVVDALEVLADQAQNQKLKNALMEVARKVSEGSRFNRALRDYPNIFPEIMVNLVEVGEETGGLEQALDRASLYFERMAKIKGKIKSASFYPTFVVVVATIIVGGILYFLVPTFAQMYESMGGSLPWPTQVLINFSNFLRANIFKIILFLVGFVALFRYVYSRSYSFKRGVHLFLLKLPKFGQLFLKSSLAQFSRTMSALFSSGVAIERSIEIAGKVVGNLVIREHVLNLQREVTEGERLYKAMEKEGVFPVLIIAMIKVGEETGQLSQMLDTVANFYEEEVDRLVEGLISLIEPLLMVFIGGAVGLILIALYLPIFKMGELMMRH